MLTPPRCVNLLITFQIALVAAACSGTPVSPTPLRETSAAMALASPSGPSFAAPPDAPLLQSYTVQFTGVGPDRTPVTTYAESGFTLSATLADWIAYGDGSSIVFYTSTDPSMSGEITVRTDEGLSLFRFTSVELYSSLTPIPYVFTGSLRGNTVFTESGTVPNTFGRFAQVSSAYSNVPIDTLVIRLTNAKACCVNPMGLDNLVLRR